MTSIDNFMANGVRQGVFSGGVLWVSRAHRTVFHRAYGRLSRFSSEPVTQDTCFDLASLTKPLATALAVAKLVQSGEIFPAQTLGGLVDCRGYEDKKKICIDQLLRHTSGFPAHRPFYQALVNLPCEARREHLRNFIMAVPLAAPPGTRQIYSDLGYMVLAWIIEQTTGMLLDRFMDETFFYPLNLNLFFRPLKKKQVNQGKSQFAATEACPWRGRILSGEVHDDNAWAVGGVEGHAGLFGTAQAVGKLLGYMLDAIHGDSTGKIPGKALGQFIKKEFGRERVAGFDTPSLTGSSAGRYFSDKALGHLGFTGTSFWMEPDSSIVVVLLTNRVHPSRDNLKIRQFRPRLHDLVMEKWADVSDAGNEIP
ncbi:serine hydrolase domain-containing protein [Desulfocicer niacini]